MAGGQAGIPGDAPNNNNVLPERDESALIREAASRLMDVFKGTWQNVREQQQQQAAQRNGAAVPPGGSLTPR
jgi:hypothetical protein